MATFLIAAAVAIIAALSAVAIYYLTKLHLLNKAQLAAKAQNKAESEARINQSVFILAKSLLAEQVPLAEAALRISALVEGLEVKQGDEWLYVSFQKLAQSIAHIPILEDWKKLSRKERETYRKQISEQETKYKEFILKAATGLVEKHSVQS